MIKKAFIKFKQKILDFKDNNLNVIAYSDSVNKFLNLSEVKNRIFSLTDKPNYIPYVTSYYNRLWGFCMKHNQKEN